MNPRDLFFATHHQAAQVVTAMMLGVQVDSVHVSSGPQDNVWSLDSAAFEDVQTICAAGFEMELALGRMQEHAWTRSAPDRTLLSESYTGRTGVPADLARSDAQFREGALSSKAIIEHQSARKAIDLLADAMNDAYGSKDKTISGAEIRKITGLDSASRTLSLS